MWQPRARRSTSPARSSWHRRSLPHILEQRRQHREHRVERRTPGPRVRGGVLRVEGRRRAAHPRAGHRVLGKGHPHQCRSRPAASTPRSSTGVVFPDDHDPAHITKMMTPMGMAEPEQLASLFAYVASDEASYMTGAIVSMDGGAHHLIAGSAVRQAKALITSAPNASSVAGAREVGEPHVEALDTDLGVRRRSGRRAREALPTTVPIEPNRRAAVSVICSRSSSLGTNTMRSCIETRALPARGRISSSLSSWCRGTFHQSACSSTSFIVRGPVPPMRIGIRSRGTGSCGRPSCGRTGPRGEGLTRPQRVGARRVSRRAG